MLDVIAAITGVLGVVLSGTQVYYARIQARQRAESLGGGDPGFGYLRFARPWRPGWVQLFLGAALVGLAVAGLEKGYGGYLTYRPPSEGLSAAMLILGLISAVPTAAYQASRSMAVLRLLLGLALFVIGAAAGHAVPIYGFSTLALLTAAVVMLSAVAYGARSQAGWKKFWHGVEVRYGTVTHRRFRSNTDAARRTE
jgi:hypothetical protein